MKAVFQMRARAAKRHSEASAANSCATLAFIATFIYFYGQ